MRTGLPVILLQQALLLGLMVLATGAHAADDTARFQGKWEATVPANGQMVTVMSVHDGNGYKNAMVLPTGNVPLEQGHFSAANGRYTTASAPPNNVGTYRFIDADTVVCTNAAGQSATWKRQRAAPQQVNASPPAAPVATAVQSGRPGTFTTPPEQRNAPAAPTAQASAAYDPKLPPATNAAIAAFNRKDYKTAWDNFMVAAQQGDSEAQAGVGAMLFSHLNPPATGYYAQAEKWLLASANQGNVKGMTFLAQFYFADGRNIAGGINPMINNASIPPQLQAQAEKSFAKSREWYERAAAKGDGYAMGNLATMLDAGVGGPRDPVRAAQLRAGVSGHADADFTKRINTDPETQAYLSAWAAGHYGDALQNAQARAAKGDAKAEALLGRAYSEGVGVPLNYATALIWLNKAVAQNNADAMFFLGLMYEHGRGVQQNIPKSVELFDRAAAMGQHYADMEAAGMRMQGEANRQAAQAHHGQSTEDIACGVAGGTSGGGVCIRGGQDIDPYNATANENN